MSSKPVDIHPISSLLATGRAQSSVPLEPFVHQVGGHFPMVCLDTDTVCKPLKDREHKFYKLMPSVLKPFVPGFEGTMKVETSEDEDGYITLRGQPPPDYSSKSPSRCKTPTQRHYRLKRKESLEFESTDLNPTPVGTYEDESAVYIDRKSSDGSVENADETVFYNPWALKCHRDHLRKLDLLKTPPADASIDNSNSKEAKKLKTNNPQMYLLLENLVSRYQNPCILDLKVGSRQYADEVSVAKKQRKIAKTVNTTLGSLGVRLCGMQVYNSQTGKYVCHNKYFGRSLNPNSFQKAIKEFLSNGSDLRKEVMKQLLQKLEDLLKVLQTLDSYRFYTSSLLITYDGKSSEPESSKSSTSSSEEDISMYSEIVDVRIIDFAHSTQKGLKDSIAHTGPDEGFIEGLKNFIAILKDISDPDFHLELSQLCAQKHVLD